MNPANENSVNELYFLDLAQVGSLVNRFALKQGMEYFVESIELWTNGSAQAAVFRLPEHWSAINAWEKTFRMWKEQQKESADEAGIESTEGRYNDFKIYFDPNHQGSGVGANLIPIGYTATPPASGGYEWIPSQVVVPNDGGVPGNSVEYELHLLGDDAAASKGMIKAYAESRSRPPRVDPNFVNVPVGGLFGEMQDVGEELEDVVDNFQSSNNEPPYIIDAFTGDEYYPGGANQGLWSLYGNYNGNLEDILTVRAGTSAMASDAMPGFVAPCGLLAIAVQASVTPIVSPAPAASVGSLLMRVTLAPGKYKGLAAREMQDVN